MSSLFSRLPPPPKRSYVPHRLDCSDLDQLIALYKELLERPIPTIILVKKWLHDVQELAVVTEEYDALTYIRKSINTRDQKAQRAYLHLIQKIHPKIAPFLDELNQKLLNHPLRSKFPREWKLMLRSRENEVSLFRKKNIPLDQKIEETANEYSKIMGGLEVKFEGKKHTLAQMGVYLERTDRDLRKRAWETVAQKRYEVQGKVETIYDKLVNLRTQVARNAGFKNFRDYCHQKYDRFDYTPKECFTFHDSIEAVVVPAVRQLRERRRFQMGVNQLKPWDLAVDPMHRPPMKPFENGKQLAELSRRVFSRLDPQLGLQFQSLIRHGVLDLDSRPGKEPGGYQSTLPERQLPFIFMNAVGRDSDVRTLLHEGGHAFHMLASCHHPVLDYRHAPIEFCEVASMSMELLANKHMASFYPNQEDRERSAHVLLEGTLEVLPWIATVDAFQQWIYTHPSHNRTERRAAWMKLRQRFADGTDWSEHQQFEEVLWHRQLHLFGVPFYYIEYAIAQIGALMVWHRSLKEPSSALRLYKNALKLGGSVGLRDLFRAIGGRLDFSTRTMKPLVEAVMERLR
jgi:oligoendopeptidase F